MTGGNAASSNVSYDSGSYVWYASVSMLENLAGVGHLESLACLASRVFRITVLVPIHCLISGEEITSHSDSSSSDTWLSLQVSTSYWNVSRQSPRGTRSGAPTSAWATTTVESPTPSCATCSRTPDGEQTSIQVFVVKGPHYCGFSR